MNKKLNILSAEEHIDDGDPKVLQLANDADPLLPASIASHVEAVIGLSNLATPTAKPQPTLDHLPKLPTAPAAPGKPGVTITGPGGLIVPPKRGNRNLLKAVCGCGLSIRVSQGVLDAAQPTCQTCSEVFQPVGR